MIFRYTILYVDDVSASLDFFERAFGFDRGFLHESGDLRISRKLGSDFA